jgi:hypothetical protein
LYNYYVFFSYKETKVQITMFRGRVRMIIENTYGTTLTLELQNQNQ